MNHDGPSPFGQRLRKQRRANFLTQRELAQKIGTSQVMVWRWETGLSVPSLRNRPRIATALNIDPSILFDGVDDEAAA